jgi:uncharacterized membrane protein YjjP (DUF1212 family)
VVLANADSRGVADEATGESDVKPDSLVAKYLSRNFHLVLLVIGISAVALFSRLITGGEWVAVSGACITAFRAGDAMVEWLHSRNRPPDK